jgi:hypothetical protein
MRKGNNGDKAMECEAFLSGNTHGNMQNRRETRGGTARAARRAVRFALECEDERI